MHKATAFLLFSIVLFGGGIALLSSFHGRTSEVVPPSTEIPAVLEAEGKRYELEVAPESTAYDLMLLAQEETDFSFSGREFAGLGFFVEEIQGKRQNPREGRYWIYSVNGQKVELGVSLYKLKANDVISWSYEKEE